MKQKVEYSTFKVRSGKWQTTGEIEVDHDDYLHRVWERAEQELRKRFGAEVHIVIRTPGHAHDHQTMFVGKETT